MKKKTVKINESALRKIVAESVKKVLKEEYDWYHYNDRRQKRRHLQMNCVT